jgi:5'-nucleotidase (lipoprotein e(P4) family)
MKMMFRAGALLLCAAGLTACAGARRIAEAPGCPAGNTVPALADDNFRVTLWQQSAAEYDALSLQVYARADAMLKRAIDEGWSAIDASEVAQPVSGNRIAIIADVDETLLDNSAFGVRQLREPMPPCITPAAARVEWDRRWSEWVGEAEAPALPGAAEFMRRAVALGNDAVTVEVFYVTNRKDSEKAATCENLRRTNFPLPDCDTYVLTRNDADGRGKDKVSRRRQVAATHRVALMFGDNLGDFVGNVMTDEKQRDAQVTGKARWWGERWFMLPNPTYGSWDEILGHIDDRRDDFATAAERNAHVRALKERRLEDCRQRDCLAP